MTKAHTPTEMSKLMLNTSAGNSNKQTGIHLKISVLVD